MKNKAIEDFNWILKGWAFSSNEIAKAKHAAASNLLANIPKAHRAAAEARLAEIARLIALRESV